MLALSVVEEIDRLLKEGRLSQRKIARQLGVSRGTVSAIARGDRALFGKTAQADEREGEPLGPPARCPQCGFLVYIPCLVCRTREYRAGRRALASLGVERRFGGAPRRPAAGAPPPAALCVARGLNDQSRPDLPLIPCTPCGGPANRIGWRPIARASCPIILQSCAPPRLNCLAQRGPVSRGARAIVHRRDRR